MQTARISIFVLVMLALAALACGSSADPGVQVNTPAPAVEAPAEQPAETTATLAPTEAPVGSSYQNPAPAGSEIVVAGMAVQVLDVVRPANDAVAAGNTFNATPAPDREYALVRLLLTCRNGDGCSYSTFEFKIALASGNVVDPGFIVGVPEYLETGEMFDGASVEGVIAFEVPTGEALILYYEPFAGFVFEEVGFLALP